MSVDLPAPFSPSKACTSPRRTSNETPSLATTPGNSLRMSRISRTRSSATGCFLQENEEGGPEGPPSHNRFVLCYLRTAGGLSLPLMIFVL